MQPGYPARGSSTLPAAFALPPPLFAEIGLAFAFLWPFGPCLSGFVELGPHSVAIIDTTGPSFRRSDVLLSVCTLIFTSRLQMALS